MDFEVTQEMKELAQIIYELHRKLWLKRIHYMIRTGRYEPLYVSYDDCVVLCAGCRLSNIIDEDILEYCTECHSCLYKLVTIKGDEVESCDSCGTVYDEFLNACSIEEKIRWAWEIYYWPMADIWRM